MRSRWNAVPSQILVLIVNVANSMTDGGGRVGRAGRETDGQTDGRTDGIALETLTMKGSFIASLIKLRSVVRDKIA